MCVPDVSGRWATWEGRTNPLSIPPYVLVRQLVALLTATMEPGQVEHLLDVEVNGVRCRCQRVTAPAAGQTALSPREREIVRGRQGAHQPGHRGRPGNQHVDGVDLPPRIFAKLQVNSRAAMVAGVMDAENQSPVARS